MAPAQPTTRSFVVRIWVEEATPGTGHPIWRGHVTALPSEVRTQVDHLDEIAVVIAPSLLELGVHLGWHWRMRIWRQRRRR